MGIMKSVEVKGKIVMVRTLTFGDVLRGKGNNLNEMIWNCLRPEDQLYLEEIEFSPELNKEMDMLIKAFLEVNPALTAEKAKDFLPEKKTENSGSLSSGSPENSTGNQAK